MSSIEKIVSIKNLGRLNNLTSTGDAVFKKVNLIYGENGAGKSTLCSMFRSIRDGNHDILIGRKTLGSENDIYINILCNNGTLRYQNDEWDGTIDNIEIFDNQFISDNVFTGNEININHRRNLPNFILGDSNVAMSEEITTIQNDISKLNPHINEKEAALNAKINGIITIDSFIALENLEDVDETIKQLEKEISDIENVETIKSKSELSFLDIPRFGIGRIEEILKKTLDQISSAALEKVEEHINTFHNGTNEAWISKGLGYIKNEHCPFCEQSIRGVDLINHYKAFFSDEYEDLKTEIEQSRQKSTQSFNEQLFASLERQVELNTELYSFWKADLDNLSELNEIDVKNILHIFREVKDIIENLWQQKENKPLEQINMDLIRDKVEVNEQIWRRLRDYNVVVSKINKKIENRKNELEAASKSDTEEKLKTHKLIKTRYEENTAELVESYQELVQKKSDLVDQKSELKDKLNNASEEILEKYELKLNEYLDRFNANFRIVKHRITYPSGHASMNYKISINDAEIDVGDSNSPDSIPTFRNTLSDGDKNCLALAFYFAKLELCNNLSDKLLIVDDPVNSLGNSRRLVTQNVLFDFNERVKQIIILTHEPIFAKRVEEKFPTSDLACIKIVDDPIRGKLESFNPILSFRNKYYKHYFQLAEFIESRNGSPTEVRGTIRKLLENNLRFRFPKSFCNEKIYFGTMLQRIRECDSDSELHNEKENLPLLYDLNEFSNPEHHGELVEEDIEALSNSLVSYAEKAIRYCTK